MRGWWRLEVTNIDSDDQIELSDADLEYIAELIKQGFTSGEIIQEVD